MKKHFLIKVLEWGSKRSEGFTKEELFDSFNLEAWEKIFLESHFKNADSNFNRREGAPHFTQIPETIFYKIGGPSLYVITAEAVFRLVDYQELVLARKTAEEARKFSQLSIRAARWSLSFAVVAIVVSVVIPLLMTFYFTQSVKIYQPQFESIHKLFTATATSSASSSTSTTSSVSEAQAF